MSNQVFENITKKDKINNIFGTTKNPHKQVNCKIIRCGKIVQVYIFENHYLINDKNYEKIEDNLITKETYIKEYKQTFKQIDLKNLIRSKNQMIRIVNANLEKFQSFLTLTFDDEITDLTIAGKEYHKFITKIKRTFPEFLCIAVPEFQKNGRVHYHLLTNINFYEDDLINENLIINKLYQNKTKSQIEEFIKNNMEEELLKKYNKKDLNKLDICFRLFNGKYENTKCSFNKKKKQYEIFKTIRYWNNGYSNIIPLDNIDIVGYMSKYMTKDYDKRLFGRHRYLCSGNLIKPIEEHLNLNNINELEYLNRLLNNGTLTFTNDYITKITENNVKFFEIKIN